MFPKRKASPERLSSAEYRRAWKNTFDKRRGRYGIKKAEGRTGKYDSGLEREYYEQELLPRQKAGEIKDVVRAPQLYFEINGIRIRGYKPDFTYWENAIGLQVWDELKGEATDKDPMWGIVQNLWRALGPGPLRIIKGSKKGWARAREIHPVMRGREEG